MFHKEVVAFGLILSTTLLSVGCGSSRHNGGGSPSPSPSPSGLTVSALSNGTQNQPYTSTLTASGGTAPYTFGVTNLPAGLILNGSTGAVSGTPTQAGPFNVTSFVTDANNNTANMSFTLTIFAVPQILTTSLPSGNTGSAYNQTLQASGTAPFIWSVGGGSAGLPPGLTIDTSTGVISGTPTQAGSYSPVFALTDSSGSGTVTKTIPLMIQ